MMMIMDVRCANQINGGHKAGVDRRTIEEGAANKLQKEAKNGRVFSPRHARLISKVKSMLSQAMPIS